MNGRELPGAWGCGWEEEGGNMPRTTPEGMESPNLHTGQGISHPATPLPSSSAPDGESSSRGDTQTSNILERWRAQHPPINP